MPTAAITQFRYVQESGQGFLGLFPDRYDYIYAQHPNFKERPEWQTESRYPLSDRIFLEGKYLFGVRPKQKTQYVLLDIDRHSPYHPANALLAIDRLSEALEPLGLVDHITCTSSDSQGLHLYFPLDRPFNSWKLSKAVSVALKNAGFKLKLGHLEIFPNSRTYSTSGKPSLFNAHRLPLQMGSYILNDELYPVSSSRDQFTQMWRLCQRKNDLNDSYLKKLLKSAQQYDYRLSNKSGKFLDDLNAEIESGWTEHGQTNRLLGRIAMRAYIFNHIISGGEPLTGKALAQHIVLVAKALPGYRDWCRHQHEIENRAAEWARCIESSRYFPYGTQAGKYKALKPEDNAETATINWNDQRARETQAKIVQAMQTLKEQDALPEKITARFKALLKQDIGGASLYRYRELWHPIDLAQTSEVSKIQNTVGGSICTGGATAPAQPTSLLSENASNSLSASCLTNFPVDDQVPKGSNSLDSSEPAAVIRDRIKRQLAQLQKSRSQNAANPVLRDDVTKAIHKRVLQRMREFLLSGEPILIMEVGQWLTKQSQEVRDELVTGSNDSPPMLADLAEMAVQLVQTQLLPYEVRSQLEALYKKSTILELTAIERSEWLNRSAAVPNLSAAD